MERRVRHEQDLRSPPSTRSFEEVAAQQGIGPIVDFESLIGHPSPEDESADEFSALLRTWRRETTGAPEPNLLCFLHSLPNPNAERRAA
jgi:hypothetical protein